MPSDVRVWQLEVDCQNGSLRTWLAQLSRDEQERCLRYRRPADRWRYAAAHAALRHLLARRLHIPAEHIAFGFNPFGKPRLANHNTPFFNLSHAGSFVLIALSDHRPVGVDIEAFSPAGAGIHQLFTPDEQRFCSQHPDAAWRIWSGKEAVLKAWGVGIGEHIQAVSVLPTAAGRYAVSFSILAPSIEAWQLPAPMGFVAALALSSAAY
nr:4'-phosphopantetheinyl transferase superfamily protein [uncultured Albidiferax sp.]